MRNPASLRPRAVALFIERGVTAHNLDNFDANALARIASEVVATLTHEFGREEVLDFVNASFAEGGIASMLACGPKAQARRRSKRG